MYSFAEPIGMMKGLFHDNPWAEWLVCAFEDLALIRHVGEYLEETKEDGRKSVFFLRKPVLGASDAEARAVALREILWDEFKSSPLRELIAKLWIAFKIHGDDGSTSMQWRAWYGSRKRGYSYYG